MSMPLVNHRPLKGKEDGIFNFAYTFTRPNPAKYYFTDDFTATSPILPLKNPHLRFSCSYNFTQSSIMFPEKRWESGIEFDKVIIPCRKE